MYKTVSFSNIDKKEVVETEIHTYRYFDLGQSLADFMPNSIPKTATITNGKESFPILQKLKKTLFEFYSECENDKSLYNVKYFLNKLSNNGYSLPRIAYRYDEEGNEICLEYSLNTENEEKNKIDYMLAVAFELVKRKITIKRCEACEKKWIVVYKKDTYYCKECAEIRNKKRDAIGSLAADIKSRLMKKRYLYLTVPPKYEFFQNRIDEINNRVNEIKYDRKKTLTELDNVHTWLKTKSKEWFPRKKKNEIRNDEERRYKNDKIL